MSTTKECCPLCDQLEGLPLIYGEFHQFEAETNAKIKKSELIYGGKVSMLNEQGQTLNRSCQFCGFEWAAESETSPHPHP
ncbi:MAG: hypothetical protein P4L87_01265 [Formivibrio sp.]|nr:hypothetical protein [Formivibrio sp.]